MGVKFDNVNGGAKKEKVDYFEFKFGENRFRMFGDILPRYLYWKKSPDDSNIGIECLSFNRQEERFTNVEKDWFHHYFPDEKCKWSYVVNAIDLKENKECVVALKKKVFEQILEVAKKHFGDPTSIEDGWDVIIEKRRTGPHAFNVEYTLDQLSLKKRALNESEKTIVENAKSIDEKLPRQTPDEQRALIERIWFSTKEEDEEANEAVEEFGDDIPF